jgi:hypothetical protein
MQDDIYDVVAGRRITPKMMFHPEGSVYYGVILRRRAKLKPDSDHTADRLKSWTGNMSIVVPEYAAPQGRPVGYESCRK